MTLDPDPHRLAVSAHEAGHAVIWKAAGFTIVDLWVTGHGPRAHGYTELDGKKCATADEFAAYLVGLLAGREAEARWCDANRLRVDLDDHCAIDMKRFRKGRKERGVRHITDDQFKDRAAKLVIDNWRKIETLAPRLCERGRVAI
jgi:hypothetical protein